ncbi:MAG: MATE family efflux transporter [Lentisphaeria bacterium]|nr:MATE family efflux transporter [Lentisphaeria bacterium]
MAGAGKYQIDMCNGPLLSKIIRFSLPLMAANVMQLLFHAVGLVVLGRFAQGEAIAAVGATSGLTVLILNIFLGMATGVNVLAARYIGAKDSKRVSQTVHTAMAISLYGGAAMGVISLIIAKPMLVLMATPENIIDKSTLYMWIYSLGVPSVILYNFGSAILRAEGDTRRPLIFMAAAGVVNIIMNLFFVVLCNMDVAGVALAAMIGSIVSAVLVMRALLNSAESTRLVWSKLKIHWDILKDMLKIGLPAGFQGSMFSISNITIQSAVNSFGWQAIAGNTAALSLEGIVYVACSSYYYTAISFVGQNHGAGKINRIIKSVFYCALCTFVAGMILGWGCFLSGNTLLGFYNSDPAVVQWGMIRLRIMFTVYFLCGWMDVVSGSLRGLGHSVKPMLVIMMGVCGLRVVWVFWILPLSRSMQTLFVSYPVSWILVITINGLMLFWILRRMQLSKK